MYAITDSSYRAIGNAAEALEFERVVIDLPVELVRKLEIDDGKLRRNFLLRASDWTQVPDSPLPALEISAWALYRQNLRDLPENPDFPDCPWPVAPELGYGAADAGGWR